MQCTIDRSVLVNDHLLSYSLIHSCHSRESGSSKSNNQRLAINPIHEPALAIKKGTKVTIPSYRSRVRPDLTITNIQTCYHNVFKNDQRVFHLYHLFLATPIQTPLLPYKSTVATNSLSQVLQQRPLTRHPICHKFNTSTLLLSS